MLQGITIDCIVDLNTVAYAFTYICTYQDTYQNMYLKYETNSSFAPDQQAVAVQIFTKCNRDTVTSICVNTLLF